MSEGDTLDNDCDGRIEEEKRDDIDNDGDGIVDEDLIKPNRQNGAWTEWVYTDCTKNCSELKRYGTRTCTNPVPQNFGDDCEGVSAEVQTEGCHVKHRCPGVCPEGQWNVDCTSKCERCYPDCDKWDGTCMACDIGYVLRNGKCDQ
ncbi:ectin-like, partial [Physella acuta]|uniref:ectin-like n=1 Tax=Physella acuta TaxID=109671 RepID=UPI0027DDAAFB